MRTQLYYSFLVASFCSTSSFEANVEYGQTTSAGAPDDLLRLAKPTIRTLKKKTNINDESAKSDAGQLTNTMSYESEQGTLDASPKSKSSTPRTRGSSTEDVDLASSETLFPSTDVPLSEMAIGALAKTKGQGKQKQKGSKDKTGKMMDGGKKAGKMAKKTRTPAPSTPDPWAWPTLSPTISMAPSNADYDIDVALDLFTTQFLEQFVDAKSRWEDIIAGILPRFYVDDFIRAFSACGRFLPERFVDDLFVCGVSDFIDGPGGIVAFGYPEFGRPYGEFFVPSIGEIVLDFDDHDDSNLGVAILAAFGRVLGIGSLFHFNDLAAWDKCDGGSCTYKLNSRATAEYQALSGCNTSVPLDPKEDDLECSEWSSACMSSELMSSGPSTNSSKISRMSIAALEDIGYIVNYDAADTFTVDDLDPSCVCSVTLPPATFPPATENPTEPDDTGNGTNSTEGQRGRHLEENHSPLDGNGLPDFDDRYGSIRKLSGVDAASSATTTFPNPSSRFGREPSPSHQRRKLSDEGMQRARAYGEKKLREAHIKASQISSSNDYVYLAERSIAVFYVEDNHLYNVEVTLGAAGSRSSSSHHYKVHL